MRFTDVRFVGWKKIGWAVFEKNNFFHFLGPPITFLDSKIIMGITSNILRSEQLFLRFPGLILPKQEIFNS